MGYYDETSIIHDDGTTPHDDGVQYAERSILGGIEERRGGTDSAEQMRPDTNVPNIDGLGHIPENERKELEHDWRAGLRAIRAELNKVFTGKEQQTMAACEAPIVEALKSGTAVPRFNIFNSDLTIEVPIDTPTEEDTVPLLGYTYVVVNPGHSLGSQNDVGSVTHGIRVDHVVEGKTIEYTYNTRNFGIPSPELAAGLNSNLLQETVRRVQRVQNHIAESRQRNSSRSTENPEVGRLFELLENYTTAADVAKSLQPGSTEHSTAFTKLSNAHGELTAFREDVTNTLVELQSRVDGFVYRMIPEEYRNEIEGAAWTGDGLADVNSQVKYRLERLLSAVKNDLTPVVGHMRGDNGKLHNEGFEHEYYKSHPDGISRDPYYAITLKETTRDFLQGILEINQGTIEQEHGDESTVARESMTIAIEDVVRLAQDVEQAMQLVLAVDNGIYLLNLRDCLLYAESRTTWLHNLTTGIVRESTTERPGADSFRNRRWRFMANYVRTNTRTNRDTETVLETAEWGWQPESSAFRVKYDIPVFDRKELFGAIIDRSPKVIKRFGSVLGLK